MRPKRLTDTAADDSGEGFVGVEVVSFRALGEAFDSKWVAEWDWWAIGRRGSLPKVHFWKRN